jgi:hypothetical protein
VAHLYANLSDRALSDDVEAARQVLFGEHAWRRGRGSA